MPLRSLTALLLLLAAACLATPEAAQAQDVQRPFGKVVEEWTEGLDRATQEVASPGLSAPRAETLKKRLAAIAGEARTIKENAQGEIDPLKVQLEALGPPPAEGEQPELEEIAAQRRKIEEDVAAYEARVKQADLALTRTKEVLEQIAARTFERSIQLLFRSYPLPFAPDTVVKAVPEFFEHLALLARSPVRWWESVTPEQRDRVIFQRFPIVLALALIIGWTLRKALTRWLGRDPTIEQPTYARRLTGAIADGVAHGIIPALILGGFLYRALSDSSIISGLFADVFTSFCGVMIMFTLAWALPRAVFSPEQPEWRLIPVAPHNARAISRRVTWLAGIFAADLFFATSSRRLVISDELSSLYTLVTSGLEAIAVLFLIQGRIWAWEEDSEALAPEGEATVQRSGPWGFWTTLRRLIGLVAVAIIVTSLSGYANLSRYLSEDLVISGMAVGILFVVRGLGRELIGGALRSTLLQDSLALPHRTRTRYKFWLRALLDFLIYGGGFVLVLVIWGVPPEDILAWLRLVLGEFSVGNVTISISDILVAFALFFAALFVTRAIQRILSEKVFPETDLDPGVRHSLSAGLGYVGLIIAAALAIAAVGLDLSNLALIAGALSVGIGFGLQGVVNNFVSGLILLIERPVKVGDWIVVGMNEGFVKRINVRATEIETFQRASVIIPNSELVAGTVTNWTHKDSYGRVDVPVKVAYGTDVPKVMEVLEGCLRENKDIATWPEPFVVFIGFGDSSLDFEARGFLSNVVWKVIVASDLAVAIERALRENGIEIPIPQRDLHIKSAEGLSEALRPPERPATEVTGVGASTPPREIGGGRTGGGGT